MKNRNVIILLISLILFILGSFFLLRDIYLSKQAQSEYANLENEAFLFFEEGESEEKNNAPVYATQVEEPDEYFPNFLAHLNTDFLYAKNNEYIGWICIPCLELSYPIVQHSDNEYYTHYSFEGKRNSAGAIFLDCEALSDFADYNTVIYGHNMRNKTMFGALKELLNIELSEEDPLYIYIRTSNEVRKYLISEVTVTFEGSDYYNNLPSDVKTITLSTCHGFMNAERVVVRAVFVSGLLV